MYAICAASTVMSLVITPHFSRTMGKAIRLTPEVFKISLWMQWVFQYDYNLWYSKLGYGGRIESMLIHRIPGGSKVANR